MVTRRRLLMVPPAAMVAVTTRAHAAPNPVPVPVPVPAPGPIHRGPWIRAPYDTYVRNPVVAENTFLLMAPGPGRLAHGSRRRGRRCPSRSGRGTRRKSTATSRRGSRAFAHLGGARDRERLRGALHRSGVQRLHLPVGLGFMTLFGRYGERAFTFMRTLDNFYAKQHPDGFICREIGRATATIATAVRPPQRAQRAAWAE